MGLPTAQEAVTIAVATSVEDLRAGDVVGPSDVALPVEFTVVAVLRRTYRQRLALADVVLRVEDAEGRHSEAFSQETVVYVRRWRALATITRADGTVDAIRRSIRLRPAGDAMAVVSTATLRLQPGDHFTIAAT